MNDQFSVQLNYNASLSEEVFCFKYNDKNIWVRIINNYNNVPTKTKLEEFEKLYNKNLNFGYEEKFDLNLILQDLKKDPDSRIIFILQDEDICDIFSNSKLKILFAYTQSTNNQTTNSLLANATQQKDIFILQKVQEYLANKNILSLIPNVYHPIKSKDNGGIAIYSENLQINAPKTSTDKPSTNNKQLDFALRFINTFCDTDQKKMINLSEKYGGLTWFFASSFLMYDYKLKDYRLCIVYGLEPNLKLKDDENIDKEFKTYFENDLPNLLIKSIPIKDLPENFDWQETLARWHSWNLFKDNSSSFVLKNDDAYYYLMANVYTTKQPIKDIPKGLLKTESAQKQSSYVILNSSITNKNKPLFTKNNKALVFIKQRLYTSIMMSYYDKMLNFLFYKPDYVLLDKTTKNGTIFLKEFYDKHLAENKQFVIKLANNQLDLKNTAQENIQNSNNTDDNSLKMRR